MRRFRAWALAAVLIGCGGVDGPPIDLDPKGHPPDIPAGEDPSATADSLWPLTPGSTWTYRITNDPIHGTFEKTVVVEGEQEVPGTSGARAVAVRSAQPGRADQLEELSWQVVKDGVVLRVREEDRKKGYLVRVMTWNPLVMKALAAPQPQGWRRDATVKEYEHDATGTLVDEKEKLFSWTVVATGVTVTTPAGTFDDAIQLRRERGDKEDWVRTYWLVPGIGKVREEGERTEELIRYDVKP